MEIYTEGPSVPTLLQGVEEEMAVVVLESLHHVAAAAAEVCAGRLRGLHAQMQREVDEQRHARRLEALNEELRQKLQEERERLVASLQSSQHQQRHALYDMAMGEVNEEDVKEAHCPEKDFESWDNDSFWQASNLDVAVKEPAVSPGMVAQCTAVLENSPSTDCEMPGAEESAAESSGDDLDEVAAVLATSPGRKALSRSATQSSVAQATKRFSSSSPRRSQATRLSRELSLSESSSSLPVRDLEEEVPQSESSKKSKRVSFASEQLFSSSSPSRSPPTPLSRELSLSESSDALAACHLEEVVLQHDSSSKSKRVSFTASSLRRSRRGSTSEEAMLQHDSSSKPRAKAKALSGLGWPVSSDPSENPFRHAQQRLSAEMPWESSLRQKGEGGGSTSRRHSAF